MKPVTSRRNARSVKAETTGRRSGSIRTLREAARSCRDCPLWKNATQTVFGEGPQKSNVILVGEQPGDQEDREGRPFVGPAGRLLDKALADAGIERSSLYVTNAVKHFKFLLRGKRRLHKTPGQLEIAACHQWLEAETGGIRPQLIVAMGATAARAVLGRATPVEANRGRIRPAAEDGAADILITVHPSYLLRVRPEDREQAYRRFVKDLQQIVPYALARARASRSPRPRMRPVERHVAAQR